MSHRTLFITLGLASLAALGLALSLDWITSVVALFGAAAWDQARWHCDRADEAR